MVDIETLSNPNSTVTSAILAIAAVQFNPQTGELGREFRVNVDLQSCIDAGLEVNADTLAWWINQKDPEVLRSLFKNTIHISQALLEFNNWLRLLAADLFNSGDRSKEFRLWGRSPRFDLGVMQQAYTKLNILPAWDFKLELDVRTIEWLRPAVKNAFDDSAKERGEYYTHDPMKDCKHQIKYVSAIIAASKYN
jgi:hypothetical protein